ncbi:putative cysteine-rich receptor-like protein kinase 32 [Neltuma alba]|uniref:putative cysteine-rich receptor-like protein kinase 32 n=1 Tax=Neltuma alba TaxID=207710 RepID=UPI0010A40C97|nr:putative cysteine-rich receptor-like protein kinase 32 [Prosopis alba]
MAKTVAIDQHQERTRRIVGTYSYIPPEYVNFGRYSEKSDIFSFGVCGRKNSCSYELPSINGLPASLRLEPVEGR